jgi:hypothetical protein
MTGAVTPRPGVASEASLPSTSPTYPRLRGIRRARGFYILTALFATTACTSTVTVTCPAPAVYSPGMQAEAAEEILALPPGSILTQMMIDYGALRAKLRECQQ